MEMTLAFAHLKKFGSLFVSPCPPECYLQSETKIEPDLRLPLRTLVAKTYLATIKQ